MALVTTTLSSAVGVNDSSIVVASATSFSAGRLIRVDDEWMKVQSSYGGTSTTVPVLRGQQGSAVLAHPASANVTHGLASDFSVPPAQAGQGVTAPAQRPRRIASYSAAGAITLPSAGEDAMAIINGTGALAMTLANPTKDMDGSILYIVANGKAAHTVTYTAGIGNGGASFDVGTFSASLQMCAMLIAANGFWVSVGPTSATALAGSPTWA